MNGRMMITKTINGNQISIKGLGQKILKSAIR